MKALLFALAALFVTIPGAVLAQEAAPSPPADPMQYNDPAMHFGAPAGFTPVGQRQIALADLGQDLAVAAAWVQPGANGPRRILIEMMSYNNNLEDFETTVEQQLRSSMDDAVVRTKDPIKLKNGMPAYWLEAVAGSGFNTTKFYFVAWVDGQRGVVVGINALLGEYDTKTAKKLLSDVSAVAYPPDRD